MALDVIGVGALNLDRLYSVQRIAKEGEEVGITSVAEAPGGSAANTIAGLGRLGINVGFMGAVGNDPEGKIMLGDFENNAVKTGGISILKKSRTGTVIGFVDSMGERTLYIYPAANSDITSFDTRYADKGRILHLTSFVDNRQFELQKKLVAETRAKTCISAATEMVSRPQRRTRISFSPGMLYVEKGFEALKPIIKKTSILFLNEDEIKLLTGCGHEKGSKILIGAGAEIVAVTLGAQGCFVTDGKDSYDVPAQKARVVDTTGAGDAFAAGFLYGVVKRMGTKECGKLGNNVAARCIEKYGARAGLPSEKELLQ